MLILNLLWMSDGQICNIVIRVGGRCCRMSTTKILERWKENCLLTDWNGEYAAADAMCVI